MSRKTQTPSDYFIVKYDADHHERRYAERFLKRPGLPYLSPAAIENTPHFFSTAANALRAAQAHGMSCYTVEPVSADFVRKARASRAVLEDRYVWHADARNAESFLVLRDGRAKFKRAPDAIGVYERMRDGTLRFIHETPYA